MRQERYISGALEANLTEVEDSAGIRVDHLENLHFEIVQAVDNGTVVAAVQRSIDGLNWVNVGATVAETDFAAGAGAVLERHLDGDGAKPWEDLTKWVRLTVTTHTGTGEYSLRYSGRLRAGFGV